MLYEARQQQGEFTVCDTRIYIEHRAQHYIARPPQSSRCNGWNNQEPTQCCMQTLHRPFFWRATIHVASHTLHQGPGRALDRLYFAWVAGKKPERHACNLPASAPVQHRKHKLSLSDGTSSYRCSYRCNMYVCPSRTEARFLVPHRRAQEPHNAVQAYKRYHEQVLPCTINRGSCTAHPGLPLCHLPHPAYMATFTHAHPTGLTASRAFQHTSSTSAALFAL